MHDIADSVLDSLSGDVESYKGLAPLVMTRGAPKCHA